MRNSMNTRFHLSANFSSYFDLIN